MTGICSTSIHGRLIGLGWLEDESPEIARLSFPLERRTRFMGPYNAQQREQVLSDMLCGKAVPRRIAGLFGPEPEVTVAEVDRYGLPCRTVLGTSSGLMRTDPYLDEAYLAGFYASTYRDLYTDSMSPAGFLVEQIGHGVGIFELAGPLLPRVARVAEIGCGMGGILVPFALAGHETFGCDYGDDYLDFGRRLGLELHQGSVDTLTARGPFDCIIMSHVLEHLTDPLATMAHLRTILAPDGIVYVEVPGILSVRSVYGGDILSYLQNAHVWHFTGATLRALLESVGFAVVHFDETVRCVARLSETRNATEPIDGPRVALELASLERRIRVRRWARPPRSIARRAMSVAARTSRYLQGGRHTAI